MLPNPEVIVTSKYHRITYKFYIASKYTIIRGLSGTGKTVLLDLIAAANRSVYQYERNITIDSDFRFVAVPVEYAVYPRDVNEWKRLLNTTFESFSQGYDIDKTRVVFYSDEENVALEDENFQSAIIELSYNYLFVTRNPLENLLYGLEDVYEIVHVNEYENHAVCKYLPKGFNEQFSYTKLMTEDSGSGYDFFRTYLNSVKSCYGKGNVCKFIADSKNVLFIVDSLGFGSEIYRCAEECRHHPSNGLWLIKSFEYLLLSSSLFKDRDILYLVNRYQDRNRRDLYSSIPQEADPFCSRKEDFYEQQLRDVMCALGETYSKHKRDLSKSEFGIGKCFLRDCCDYVNEHSQTYKEPCELFTKGDKFEIILGRELADKLRAMFGDKRKILSDTPDEESVGYEDDADSPVGFTSVFK